MELFWIFIGLVGVALLFGIWGWWDYKQTIKKLEEKEDALARHNAALEKANGEVKKKRTYTRRPKKLLTTEEMAMMQQQSQQKANGVWNPGEQIHPNHPNGAAYQVKD